MKREILFRGWSESLNKWVEGDLIQSNDIFFKAILPIEAQDMFEYFSVHPDSVGQFTGEVDANKVKAFEGDIGINSHGEEFVILYFEHGFEMRRKSDMKRFEGNITWFYNFTITGNTFKP